MCELVPDLPQQESVVSCIAQREQLGGPRTPCHVSDPLADHVNHMTWSCGQYTFFIRDFGASHSHDQRSFDSVSTLQFFLERRIAIDAKWLVGPNRG